MPTYKLKPGFNHYDYRDQTDEDGNIVKDTNGNPVRERYKLKAGDTIQMTEQRFIDANLKDRFIPVSDSGLAQSEEDTDWAVLIKNKKQGEVLDLINTVEDKEVVAKIYAAEESGKNREKILEAAEAKYKELGGETE